MLTPSAMGIVSGKRAAKASALPPPQSAALRVWRRAARLVRRVGSKGPPDNAASH